MVWPGEPGMLEPGREQILSDEDLVGCRWTRLCVIGQPSANMQAHRLTHKLEWHDWCTSQVYNSNNSSFLSQLCIQKYPQAMSSCHPQAMQHSTQDMTHCENFSKAAKIWMIWFVNRCVFTAMMIRCMFCWMVFFSQLCELISESGFCVEKCNDTQVVMRS